VDDDALLLNQNIPSDSGVGLLSGENHKPGAENSYSGSAGWDCPYGAGILSHDLASFDNCSRNDRDRWTSA
jgi:hypothetical protein